MIFVWLNGCFAFLFFFLCFDRPEHGSVGGGGGERDWYTNLSKFYKCNLPKEINLQRWMYRSVFTVMFTMNTLRRRFRSSFGILRILANFMWPCNIDMILYVITTSLYLPCCQWHSCTSDQSLIVLCFSRECMRSVPLRWFWLVETLAMLVMFNDMG